MRLGLAKLLLLFLFYQGANSGFAITLDLNPMVMVSNIPADSNGAIDDKTVYRIELLVSKEPVYLAPANFKGLENVEEHYDNGLFLYTSGYSNDYSYARDVLLNQIIKMGFQNPSISAFKNNIKI